MKCANLNSNEAFFIVIAGGEFGCAWMGEGADDSEKEYCQKLGAILCPGAEISDTKEGEEVDGFWDAIGGKTEYSTIKAMGVCPGFNPRLFHLSNA